MGDFGDFNVNWNVNGHRTFGRMCSIGNLRLVPDMTLTLKKTTLTLKMDGSAQWGGYEVPTRP